MTTEGLPKIALGGARFDLVGPTADDDIRRAIARYGTDAVKAAVARQTKPKRGRKSIKDWAELRDTIEADARSWLSGGDPFVVRSNYSIAKEYADRKPGHSHPATMKRIERKLALRRRWITLVTAENISRSAYPHAQHIRTLVALAEEFPDKYSQWSLDQAQSHVADYEARHGHPPPPEMPINEVEAEARVPVTGLASKLRAGGPLRLFGQAPYTDEAD